MLAGAESFNITNNTNPNTPPTLIDVTTALETRLRRNDIIRIATDITFTDITLQDIEFITNSITFAPTLPTNDYSDKIQLTMTPNQILTKDIKNLQQPIPPKKHPVMRNGNTHT